MQADIDDVFDEGELRRVLTKLLDAWESGRAKGSGFSSRAHPARVSVVYALTAHTYKLGYSVRCLVDNGFGVEAVPNIRSAYEATLTLSWIAQIDDALPAYLNRNHNQQKALRDTVAKAGWASGQKVIAADDLEPFLVSKESKAGAGWVAQLCSDFFQSDALYSVYRGMSWLAHPTAVVADLYLSMGPGAERPMLHTSAEHDARFMTTWLHMMCSSLVWSARALNLIDAERARSTDRRTLRDAAQRLQISEFLAVTPEAKFRGEKAERQRQRDSR